MKAIALFSGGLDSALACAIIMRQNITVEGVFFNTGFCILGHQLLLGKRKHTPAQPPVFRVAADMGIPLSIIDISKEYRQILLNPKYGYGRAMNPCIDCRILMLRKAREIMTNNGGEFIITGEVLGQRPMSQHRQALSLIERESGVSRLIVRPLSAKHFPATIPEEKMWIDRQKMYNFSGRSRKPQLKLVSEFGIKTFMQPSGGCCFLTEKKFAKRLHDLFQNNSEKSINQDDFDLLKVGRHLRLGPDLKIIVGRDENENHYLNNFRHFHGAMQSTDKKGPLTLIIGKPDGDQCSIIAGIVASYSNGSNGDLKEISYSNQENVKILTVCPLAREKFERWII